MAGVYFLYSATLALLLILTLPWWLVQMLRLGKYRAGLRERLGRVPARLRLGAEDAEAGRPVVWIHAVSVGEVLAIAPMVMMLRRKPHLPTAADMGHREGSGVRGYRVVVSTTTHTGQRLARDKFGAQNVFYFPLDLGMCIGPYLRALRPELVILAETEFWPNFLRLAKAGGARLAVVNARISDRSFPRYLRFRGLLRKALEPVDLFLAQSEGDAERLRAVGAAAERVEVTGNLKFDAEPPVESATVTQLGEQLRASGAPILVAGSTVENEEEHVLKAFEMVLVEHPAASLVLAPRHKERFEAVTRLLGERRVRFVRRSAADAAAQDLRGAVLLLDTLGELAAIYRYANLAFVGGSLVPRGGHNILEPAFFARAILTGPLHGEFPRYTLVLREPEGGGALHHEESGHHVSAAAARRRGARGAGRAGATGADGTARRDGSQRGAAAYAGRERAQMISDPAGWLFGQIVRMRNARYDTGRAPVQRLRLPVISVGNISVGGSGKTPFVQTVGRWLEAQGIAYDILSRGYGRSSQGVLRVEAELTQAGTGQQTALRSPTQEVGKAELYGDEPLLLARTLKAPVFVGEDRYQAGIAAEAFGAQSARPPRLHILDDGFQHRRLHRDFDLVLLAEHDLRGTLLPFGRLREPLSSLARAHAVAAPEELAALLTEPNIWHIRRRLVLHEPAPTRPLAFCGLAQPRQFWQSLADIGIYPVGTYAFGDHHRYNAEDVALLQRLARQHDANGFLTTEKDMVKLDCAGLKPITAPALVIEVENANARFSGMLEAAGVR